MKKKALFTTALVAGALTFSGFNTPAQADETADQDYAKTVLGTLEPSQFDLDGDGWADGGFSTELLPQDQKIKLMNSHNKKTVDNYHKQIITNKLQKYLQKKMP